MCSSPGNSTLVRPEGVTVLEKGEWRLSTGNLAFLGLESEIVLERWEWSLQILIQMRNLAHRDVVSDIWTIIVEVYWSV